MWGAKVFTFKGIKYAMRLDENKNNTNMLYDLDSFKRASKNPLYKPEFVGIIEGTGKNRVLKTGVEPLNGTDINDKEV